MQLVLKLRRNRIIVDCCKWLEVVPMGLNYPKHFLQQSLQVENSLLFLFQLGELVEFDLLRLVKLVIQVFHHCVSLLEHLLEVAGLLT